MLNQWHLLRLSKICAGVNSQLVHLLVHEHYRCQRSVLVSIHSRPEIHRLHGPAVKDLCWCQFTAMVRWAFCQNQLSKICAGVNSQRRMMSRWPRFRCQRSVLVSIHSSTSPNRRSCRAVKDLCWCQFTAKESSTLPATQLSKICAGVNSQQVGGAGGGSGGCQRSVLVSIHSTSAGITSSLTAVKDLCWCQFTAVKLLANRGNLLSKICAGVNSQPVRLEWIR